MYYHFVPLFDLLYYRYFTEFFFAVSNREPIQIIETVKQIGRYLIRYTVIVFCNLG